MSGNDLKDPNAPVPSAADLRMALLEKKMEEMEAKEKAIAAEKDRKAAFAAEFLSSHVTEDERKVIRRMVQNAVKNGQFEAMVYSFSSDLCTDSGRAINNAEPDWPETLQGKARELYERYVEYAKPQGYKLKAMIINFPGGMPGDVGLFLNWAPKATG
ncbi:hypothetical protein CLV78_11921 [Aliiruegeria haliotis]|uniref:Uncharacterized protein n=1 Tax=Aliiruegeria haliotis TaxID=1280846 RepID=A0A2T0REX5_9RHOB|nr:histidine kinase [Aliiruegeria haliotis]PRY19689.1 hypothetical protein CLV78_11921 [Aliiruegeria haliotis]